MKIFVQKDNYHEKKGYFALPDTAVNRIGMPLFLPEYAEQNEVRLHLAVRISRLGKHISPQFAHRYYEQATVAMTCTATDLAQTLKANDSPLTPAIGFDGAVNLGKWTAFRQGDPTRIIGKQNECTFADFEAATMLQSIDEFIAHLSFYHLLCQGDLLLCGAPFSTQAHINDTFTAQLNDSLLLHFRIK